jgi:hypothetical protein
VPWSPSQELVTLEQAKSHLKLPLDIDTEDEDLQLKLFVAHEVVMDYLTQRLDEADEWATIVQAWTADTVPKRVIAAILIQFGELYRERGDDADRRYDPSAMGTLCPDVVKLLYRLRDPAVS